MIGLNERAVLRRYLGQRGGRPAYGEPGEAFACRSERASGRDVRGDSSERDVRLRVFAPVIDVRPGDLLTIDGANYRVTEIRHLRSWQGIHHLELSARLSSSQVQT